MVPNCSSYGKFTVSHSPSRSRWNSADFRSKLISNSTRFQFFRFKDWTFLFPYQKITDCHPPKRSRTRNRLSEVFLQQRNYWHQSAIRQSQIYGHHSKRFKDKWILFNDIIEILHNTKIIFNCAYELQFECLIGSRKAFLHINTKFGNNLFVDVLRTSSKLDNLSDTDCYDASFTHMQSLLETGAYWIKNRR